MKIALISCLQQDAAYASWDEVPAEKLFNSDFFKLANIYAEKIYGADRVYFLSTKYAILKPQQIVSPYENHFGDEDMQRMRCRRIISQLILDGCDLESDEFLFLADEHYTTCIHEIGMIQSMIMPLQEMDFSNAVNYLANKLEDHGLLPQSVKARLNFSNLLKSTNQICKELEL